MSQVPDTLPFGAVAIGRNEGKRLEECLASLAAATIVVYVDSASNDGSAHLARQYGADVIELDSSRPFTAARARNAGFGQLRKLSPDLTFVQFIDGDCVLDREWPARAIDWLSGNASVAAVCGRRRERFAGKSIYNWLCDLEWNTPVGETRSFGGDVMLRANTLEAVDGYREDLIAGEEPELCVRLRTKGWRIWRLDAEMTLHDAAMTRFSQWWRRAVRAGYSYGQGAHLHGSPPERHYVWESRRAWIWGLLLPLVCLAAGFALWPWGWLTLLIFPLQMLRQTMRNSGALGERAALAFYQLLARFPEAWGEIKFLLDRVTRRQATLIEYK